MSRVASGISAWLIIHPRVGRRCEPFADRRHVKPQVLDGRLVVMTGEALAPAHAHLVKLHRVFYDARITETAEALAVLVEASRPQENSSARSSARVPQGEAGENVELMGTVSAAAELDCTEENVRALARRGTLRGVRTERGDWRFERDAIDARKARTAKATDH